MNVRFQAGGHQIKRQGLHLAFSPNLTMNLTYLCYGDPKVQASFLKAKAFGPTSINSVEMRILEELPTRGWRLEKEVGKYVKIKKVERTPPFLPQILP